LSNLVAMEILPLAKRAVEKGKTRKERIKRALLSATIGNAFDFGVSGYEVPYKEFERKFFEYFEKGFEIDDTDEIIEMLDNVVYVVDNCGEIVLDSIALRELKGVGRVTLVVRGAPILTDATLEEVKWLGLDLVVDEVLTTGGATIGILMEEAPEELKNAMDDATLVIAKGMANYETLSEYDVRPICYLMMAKCSVVARSIGTRKGSLVAKLVR